MSPTAEARIAGLEARVTSIEQRERDFYDRVYTEHKRNVEQDFKDLKALFTGHRDEVRKDLAHINKTLSESRVKIAMIGTAIALTSGGITGVIGHVLG